MKTAFIGHRQILYTLGIGERLEEAIRAEINNGCMTFTMGTHGEFDNLAFGACSRLQSNYKDMQIEVVITSLHQASKEYGRAPYPNIKNVMYDIEEAHYKQRITLSNRLMIDTCDTLICYVDNITFPSGARTAMQYAEKKGLKVVNLFRKEDRAINNMTKEELNANLEKQYDELIDKNEEAKRRLKRKRTLIE